jgi:enoyl-CoA hydratase/carnithine racemase
VGEPVTYRLSSGIAVVTIDNPPMNALSEQVKNALEAVFEELDARIEEVKVVILTGAGGKAFVAGADIKELPGLNPEKARVRFRRSR